MNNNIIKSDSLVSQLNAAGFDLDEELTKIETTSNGIDLPRIRIEHKDTGRHRIFIDNGESYLDTESQEISIEGNKLEAVVFAEQSIRALWTEGENLPGCSAIDGKPNVENPVHAQCFGCAESLIGSGSCKPKIRLWILLKSKPYIMALSPTSIKHWNNHKKKLKRSNLPVVAMNTVFSLEDVKKNGYRWAEVKVDISGVADKEVLILAKQYRDELRRVMTEVSEKDFEEPGDRV